MATSATISYILTHWYPHVDEVMAIWLLQIFGEPKFVFEKNNEGKPIVKIKFLRTGVLPHGQTAESLLEKGILCIGVGGGIFDEHATADADRKKGYSATTLVVEYLGLENTPYWPRIKEIVDRVFQNDTAGAVFGQDDICVELKKMLRVDQSLAIRFGLDAFKVLFKNPGHSFSAATLLKTLGREDYDQLYQRALEKNATDWQATKVEWKKAGQTVEFTGPRGGFRVGYIVSDNPEIGGAIRHPKIGKSDLAVIKNSRGQIQVLAKPASQIYLYEVVKLIRAEEAYLANENFAITNYQSEKMSGAGGCWYFFVSPSNKFFQLILNGSETTPDVLATKISLERIVELIRIALDKEHFPHQTCRNGQCLREKCAWFPAKLQKCFKARTGELKAKN